VTQWTVIATAVLAILVVLVALAVVDARMLPAAPWTRSVLLSLACAGTGIVAWLGIAPFLGGQAVGELFLPIAALAGVAAYLPSIAVRSVGGGVLATLVFGLLWSILVFVPTAIATFAPFGTDGPLGLQPVDHGGSLIINVASGAAALGVLVAAGRRAPRFRAATLGRGMATLAIAALCLGWITWLAAAEFAVDELTPAIMINGVFGALGGVAGWLAVQRIRHQSTTLPAVAAGLVSGLVAVTAGAPLFTPVSAAASGIIAGGLACIFTLERVSASRRQQWFVVGSHLIAGAVGVVLLGLLATNRGFLFTGQVDLIADQFTGVVSVTAYSALVSLLLWLVLKRVAVRRAVPVREPA
jgi:ammonia channel protein AmtB